MAKDNKHQCQNCGNEIENNYCSSCGQVYESRIKPFASLIRDFLGDIVAFDSRAAITIKKLIFHPGFLTKEYLIGKRVQYVPPTRLYVILSILLFFLISVNTSQDSTQLMIYPGFIEWYEGEQLKGNLGAIPMFDKKQFLTPIESDFMTTISRLIFIILPIIALIFKIIFHNKYYIEHIIHCIHIISFIFFLFIIYEILSIMPIITIAQLPISLPEYITWAKEITLTSKSIYLILLFLFIPIYIFISIKNVYNNNWLSCFLKSISFYLFSIILSFISLIIYSHLYNLLLG